ncbi:MAG: rod shape-determining protein RodA [Nitrospiraceae bacterium]|jgi:rod shape determining protein RodA|nr:MAG: rod shape-determining protein RodA [Nitrospiraceae bacterium]
MFRIDRRLIQNFDWLTLSLVVLISIIGILTIFSATRQPGVEGTTQASFYIKQIAWLAISLLALILFISFDYIWLGRIAVPVYITGLILLLIVLIAGRTGMGAQRWISLGPLSFQPSEFFKLMFIIMLATYYSFSREALGVGGLLRVFFYIVFIPFVLLFKQPDLGTAIVVLLIFISVSLAKGLQRKVIAMIAVIGIISLPFLGNIMWTGLKDYQKNRLIAFIDPEVDPSGIGYHINQSKIAIGSGEFLGKGYLNGTQGPFRFLPEKHTDFIFAVFAEEWGFVGSVSLLFLYLLLILRGLDTASKAKDDFGRLLALGITFMFCIYFFVNVGMTLGIMPVVGIPLPFMSYGGTALLSNYISLGVLINIRTRRFSLFY